MQDYLTRDLPAVQRALVDAHLLECDECRRELALMSAVMSGLSTQPVIEPPVGFTQRVLADLPARPRSFLSPWWSLALAPVLAGLAYIERVPLVNGLAGILSRLGVDPAQFTTLRLPQASGVTLGRAAFYAAAGTVLILAAFGLGTALCWRWYSESR